MKKIITAAISLALVFSMSSCTGSLIGSSSKNTNSTYTVHALYDYGFHEEGKAATLFDSSTLFFEVPQSHGRPIAGDCFDIHYNGELLIQESYPSTVVLSNGEITSVDAIKATVIKLLYTPSREKNNFKIVIEEPEEDEENNENEEKKEKKEAKEPEETYESAKIGVAPGYYVTHIADGIFFELPVEGEAITLYGTFCAKHNYDKETNTIALLGLFLKHPRPAPVAETEK